MTRYRFLIIAVLLGGACIRRNQVQEGIAAKTCCLDSLFYISNDSLLTPAFVRIALVNCDSALTDSIESVVFPKIPVKDTLFYDFGLWRVEQISPDTTVVIVDTYYFTDSGLSKDSIEHLLSEQIGVVTSKGDTIYVGPCPISKQ